MASTGTRNFTADNDTNINTLGWTIDDGAIWVQSNAAQAHDAEYSLARYTDTAMATGHHKVQATVTRGSAGVGVGARSTASYNGYIAEYTGEWSGTGLKLYRAVGGNLGAAIHSHASEGWGNGPFTLSIETETIDASTVRITVILDDGAGDKTLVFDDTDASRIDSGTYYGGIFGPYGSTCTWDDWSAEDVGGAAPSTAPNLLLLGVG